MTSTSNKVAHFFFLFADVIEDTFKNGKYDINLKPGEYQIVIEQRSFKTYSSNAVLKPGLQEIKIVIIKERDLLEEQYLDKIV